MKIKFTVGLVMFLAFNMVCQAQLSKANERGLWELWLTGTNSAFVAEDVGRACQKFRVANPTDSLVIVAAGFEAWHHLRIGNTAEAVKLFNSMLVDQGRVTGLRYAGDMMARSWLTRLDREGVVRALKKLYLRDIEFPDSLDALKTLKGASVPPLTDQWNKPWTYTLDNTIKGMRGQRYVLESSALGPRSYFKKALNIPYASEINLQPLRMARGVANVIEFRTTSGRDVVRKAGDTSNRVNLVYIGERIIVLSDGDHWSVMAKPR